jgi:dTMP kinase
MPGYFIAFEGGEGAGKSTQEGLLAQSLIERGHRVVRTREPGGTPAGEQIRHVLLSPEFEGLDPRAEALLFAASRGEHVARVIRPTLERGDVVICDRYIDSSVAYQGYGRDLGPDRVRDLSLWATGGLLPDLTVVLDVDPEVGLARFAQRDRLEAEPLDYHRAVRAGFLALAAAEPGRYVVLDARAEVKETAAAILERALTGLGEPG